MTDLERELRELRRLIDIRGSIPGMGGMIPARGVATHLDSILARFGGGERVDDPLTANQCRWWKDLRRENERLKEELEAAEDLVEKWQSASGLIGSCGDPSGIKPEHAEKYWGEVEKQLAAPTVYTSNGEAGDGQTSCEYCYLETDEPHRVTECIGELQSRLEHMINVSVDFEHERDELKEELAAHQWIPLEEGTELPECDLECWLRGAHYTSIWVLEWNSEDEVPVWLDQNLDELDADDVRQRFTHYRRFVPPEK